MERKELICINCPLGCKIVVELEEKKVVSITGNHCPKGELYARKEVTDPRRIVTSTVEVKGGDEARVPVKTKEDIPKEKIFDCVKELKGIAVQAPIKIGDVIIKNVAQTGVDIIATKNVH